MSSPAQVIAPARSSRVERIVDFSPENLKAPFFLRCAALFIDYMVLLIVPLVWLMWGKTLGEPSTGKGLGTTVWLFGVILWLVNFLLLPLLFGKTIGKMLTGLTILNVDGTEVGLFGILRRNLLGFVLTGLTLGLGFLISAVNSSGRSLHDFVAGTIVVRGRRKQL